MYILLSHGGGGLVGGAQKQRRRRENGENLPNLATMFVVAAAAAWRSR